jgi:hypothetical protein
MLEIVFSSIEDLNNWLFDEDNYYCVMFCNRIGPLIVVKYYDDTSFNDEFCDGWARSIPVGKSRE